MPGWAACPQAVLRELDGLKNSIRHYFSARRATRLIQEELLGRPQYRGQRCAGCPGVGPHGVGGRPAEGAVEGQRWAGFPGLGPHGVGARDAGVQPLE